MALPPSAAVLDFKKIQEDFDKAYTREHLDALEALAADLAKRIREGTVTLEAIDSFLQQILHLPPDLEEYLLCKKAWLLFRQGRGEEGLEQYDAALKINEESPSTWASKGAALLQLKRLDEAFQAFQKAYLLKENFGKQKQGYLTDLFGGWSSASLLRGLFGILHQNSREAQKGVDEYLLVLDKARAENLENAIAKLAPGEPLAEELQEALEELELMIRLLSIKDPFEGWRALTKEISKVWPIGVSAVDSIREQRDREWNT